MKRAKLPYLYSYYNIRYWYPDIYSDVKTSIARTFNSLIEALNTHYLLPKYIFVVIDEDFIISGNLFKFGSGPAIEGQIKWILKEMKRWIMARREDLKDVRPGAVEDRKRVVKLRTKFNEILNALIQPERFMHIMKIDIDTSFRNFRTRGQLTEAGKEEYWKSVNNQMKKFERGEIGLLAEVKPISTQRNPEYHRSLQDHRNLSEHRNAQPKYY